LCLGIYLEAAPDRFTGYFSASLLDSCDGCLWWFEKESEQLKNEDDRFSLNPATINFRDNIRYDRVMYCRGYSRLLRRISWKIPSRCTDTTCLATKVF